MQANRTLLHTPGAPGPAQPSVPCKLATVFCSSRSLRSSSAAFLSSSSCCRSRLAWAAEATAWNRKGMWGARGHKTKRDSVSLTGSERGHAPCRENQPGVPEAIPAPQCLRYRRPPQRPVSPTTPTPPLALLPLPEFSSPLYSEA